MPIPWEHRTPRKRHTAALPPRMYTPAKNSPTVSLFTKVPEDETALLRELRKERAVPDEPTDAELRIITATCADRPRVLAEERAAYIRRKEERLKNNPTAGLELTGKHRYGDAQDILARDFTMTKEEIDGERFKLVQEIRTLRRTLIHSLRSIPRLEKYSMGSDIRNVINRLLEQGIAIKRKYYRKNLLETMDVELDILREYYYNANKDYPRWVTTAHYETVLGAINRVSILVGGLLKATVA